jgi:predicted DsbA family dithiol-disulfide isomerase
MTTPAKLKIDFVSDVSCPWCAIGLNALEEALRKLDGEVAAELHFQPFELNPQMAPEGEDVGEHLVKKYGMAETQLAQNRENLRQRGETVGFTFNMDKRSRIYNTFDAHRLLHWAELGGHQQALKHALFQAYFTDGEDVSSHEVLARAAERAGLDGAQAHAVLAGDAYAAEVRAQEQFYSSRGVRAVPAVIINDQHLISGGQPADVFEQALRQIARG